MLSRDPTGAVNLLLRSLMIGIESICRLFVYFGEEMLRCLKHAN